MIEIGRDEPTCSGEVAENERWAMPRRKVNKNEGKRLVMPMSTSAGGALLGVRLRSGPEFGPVRGRLRMLPGIDDSATGATEGVARRHDSLVATRASVDSDSDLLRFGLVALWNGDFQDTVVIGRRDLLRIDCPGQIERSQEGSEPPLDPMPGPV